MSTIEHLMGAAVDLDGNPILSEGITAAEKKKFFELFFGTEIGKRLLVEVGIDQAVEQLIGQYAQKHLANTHQEFLTLPEFESLVVRLLETRAFPEQQPSTPEPEQEDPRPRNTDGTFKSEFETYCESHSMQEIRARVQSDREFGNWFRSAYNNQTIVEGEYRLAGQPTETIAKTPELEEFARIWRTTPSSVLRRPVDGHIEADGHRWTVAEFNNLVNRASAAKLI